jgi:cell division protein ZapA (FtsZ GTPase activity inhibitor)
MNQDINTVIADFVNAAVERKFKELAEAQQQEQGSTPMGKILTLEMRLASLEVEVAKLKANSVYTPDHVMARINYMEGALNATHNTASIKQMIEDQIHDSQQKVEDMLEEKFEEFDVAYKLEQLLEESINDGTISITFKR